MAEPPSPIELESVRALAEILLGAAHSDGRFVGTEALAIHRILRDVFGIQDLPPHMEQQLYAFDPKTFDLEATCKRLPLSTPDERRALLALVSEVIEADNIHDFDEDTYIRQLARVIGASAAEYDDLTLDVVAVKSLAAPPPLPKG